MLMTTLIVLLVFVIIFAVIAGIDIYKSKKRKATKLLARNGCFSLSATTPTNLNCQIKETSTMRYPYFIIKKLYCQTKRRMNYELFFMQHRCTTS